ncbi:ABC transporter permease [Corynebacterium sp. CNCTC7651]|nr:ABC transporter permease [Corynebacterium sp. CNCTC7651]UIZ92470.1 ABC transporter permease [Corynebacterium sp. CNCTC7651]
MDRRDAIRLAGTSLRANKLRSILTLLGVIIGISAVVAIMSLGKGMQQQLLSDLEQFGLKDVNVQVKSREQVEGGNETFAYEEVPDASLITPAMVDDLRAFVGPSASGVAIDASRDTAQLTRGLNQGRAALSYVNGDFLEMQRLNMAAGRIFTEDEVAENRAVGVLSPEVVDKFFNGDPASAVGASIDMEVGGRFATVQVVGTFERESASPLVYSPEEALVYVPYTLQERLSADPVQGFSYLQVRAASQDGTDQLASDVRAWAERAYADDPDFVAQVLDTKSEIDQVNQTMAMMSLVISAIGGISLLVGGIGVMNIMLVSVTERTREIGVRMALGATRKAVRMQFVTEAMMICLLGGVIGVLLGTAVGIAGTSAMGMMVFPPLSAVVIALVFSLAIGLFFGWYPANRAARMNPIEALRYE